MRKLTMVCAVMFGAALPTGGAEAARCKQGYIYRSSIGVCQTKATAIRQGIRIKRYTKRSAVRLTYQQHVEQWVKRNRKMLIRRIGGERE